MMGSDRLRVCVSVSVCVRVCVGEIHIVAVSKPLAHFNVFAYEHSDKLNAAAVLVIISN